MRSHMLAPAAAHAGPNMTPLVDVVMVILIFLMLAGGFGSREHFVAGRVPAGTVIAPPPGPVTELKATRRIEVHVQRTAGGADVMRVSGGLALTDPDALTATLAARRAELAAAGGAADVQVVIRPPPTPRGHR